MSSLVETKFDRIGARAKVRRARAGINGTERLSINILEDSSGEYFEIRQPRDLRLDAVDVQARDRHLLLVASGAENPPAKFLCGHDERHWFVAAVPEMPGVRNVETAKDALIPAQVRDAVDRLNLPRNVRHTRRNRAFIRQGEWFFVPAPEARIDRLAILRHEPIRRGAGKPHFCQELYRSQGTSIYVRRDFPNGLTERAYQTLDEKVRARGRWTRMRRDAVVHVRGYVRHPDHATIWLEGWHRVFMNTETLAPAMRHVAFLD